MQAIESKDQFIQEAQELIQRIDVKINDLSQSHSNNNKPVTESTTEEITRLENQRQNLQEALERYGNESDENWSKVKTAAQYALDEVNNTWLAGTAPDWSNNKENDSKWRLSTGQSDHGGYETQTGLGDRGGMEDPTTGLDNTTQYSSFGNPYDKNEKEEQERSRHESKQERIHQPGSQGQGLPDQNNEDETRKQGDPKDWKTKQNNSSIADSYEKMKANDRREEKEQERLSRTNRGDDATQDNPGGSAGKDKENTGRDFNRPRTNEREQGESGK